MHTQALVTKLKSLRLGGMMDTLDMRVQEAQKGNLGYLVFLEMLLEDENNRRAQKTLSQRLRRAHFEDPKTLSEFDFTYNPNIPAPLIRDLSTCGYLERKESILLFGPVGVGKSHIAQSLGHTACMKGYSVIYTKTNRLMQDLGGGHADGTWDIRLRKYIATDLLILDDFGMKELSPQQAEDIYELVCERYRVGSMIVVSNRAPKDWYTLFPNPVYAEGSLDRLINSAHQVFMPGRSYRPKGRPGQPPPEEIPITRDGTSQGGESGA